MTVFFGAKSWSQAAVSIRFLPFRENGATFTPALASNERRNTVGSATAAALTIAKPLEILERAIELRIAHREQQSQPLYLIQDLKASSAVGNYGPLFSIPTHSTLDLNCNTPDEEMDHLISDEIGDDKQNQL